MEMASDGAMADNVQQLNGIMSRQSIDRKRGPANGRILKSLVYGGQLMPDKQIKIERIRRALADFARRQKEDGILAK